MYTHIYDCIVNPLRQVYSIYTYPAWVVQPWHSSGAFCSNSMLWAVWWMEQLFMMTVDVGDSPSNDLIFGNEIASNEVRKHLCIHGALVRLCCDDSIDGHSNYRWYALATVQAAMANRSLTAKCIPTPLICDHQTHLVLSTHTSIFLWKQCMIWAANAARRCFAAWWPAGFFSL